MPHCDVPAPCKFVAGDTVSWTVELANYSSASWSLTYAFSGPSSLTITAATVSDGSFLATLTAVQSATLAAGSYIVSAFVTGAGSERHTVLLAKAVQVLPNPAVVTGPSFARQALDTIESVMVGRITDQVNAFTIDGQQVTKIPVEQLPALRLQFRLEVQQEERAARLAAGLPGRRRILTRFRSPAWCPAQGLPR